MQQQPPIEARGLLSEAEMQCPKVLACLRCKHCNKCARSCAQATQHKQHGLCLLLTCSLVGGNSKCTNWYACMVCQKRFGPKAIKSHFMTDSHAKCRELLACKPPTPAVIPADEPTDQPMENGTDYCSEICRAHNAECRIPLQEPQFYLSNFCNPYLLLGSFLLAGGWRQILPPLAVSKIQDELKRRIYCS